jgi:hypothetical protein
MGSNANAMSKASTDGITGEKTAANLLEPCAVPGAARWNLSSGLRSSVSSEVITRVLMECIGLPESTDSLLNHFTSKNNAQDTANTGKAGAKSNEG